MNALVTATREWRRYDYKAISLRFTTVKFCYEKMAYPVFKYLVDSWEFQEGPELV